jgi:hypothetical protein
MTSYAWGQYDDDAADEVRARMRALFADPAFIRSQTVDCLLQIQAATGPLEQLRAGLARLRDARAEERARETLNQLHNITLALYASATGEVRRVAFAPHEQAALTQELDNLKKGASHGQDPAAPPGSQDRGPEAP